MDLLDPLELTTEQRQALQAEGYHCGDSTCSRLAWAFDLRDGDGLRVRCRTCGEAVRRGD